MLGPGKKDGAGAALSAVGEYCIIGRGPEKCLEWIKELELEAKEYRQLRGVRN